MNVYTGADYALLAKATILLAFGLLSARLATRATAATRHILLSTAFFALLALPLLIALTPKIVVEIPASVAPLPLSSPSQPSLSEPALETPRAATPAPQSEIPWVALLHALWIAGAGIILLRLTVDLWRLRSLRRDGLPSADLQQLTRALAADAGIHRPVEILLHEQVSSPLTYGLFRPSILLPIDARTWATAELRRTLVHELEHVRRVDWFTQLAARVACACFWFHPMVWSAWRRLCLEAERACDDSVLRSEPSADYASQLLSLAERLSHPHAQPAIGMARRSDLSVRISSILDESRSHGRASLQAVAITFLTAALLLSVLAPLQAVAQSENSLSLQGRSADTALYEAAGDGDLPAMQRWLSAGANVNCSLLGDGSPLIAAARNGHLAAVRLLLDRGADPNMAVRGDGNPLIMAARSGRVEVVELLLNRGAAVDEAVPGDENALIQASGAGRISVVQLLVSRGANVNTRIWAENEWRSPLAMARKHSHTQVAAYLQASGARE